MKYPEIYYQDLVKASISGTVTLQKKAASLPLELECDAPGKDGKKVAVSGSSDAKGAYTLALEPLAEYDKTIECVLKLKASEEYADASQKVTLKEPDFKASGVALATTYNAIEVTVTGSVSESDKDAVPGAEVSLAITPEDPLAQAISAKTDAKGAYTLKFEVVKSVAYSGVLDVKDAPFFDEYKSQAIKIQATAPLTLNEPVTLKRTVQNTKVTTSLEDQDGKPIPGAKVCYQSQCTTTDAK